MNSKKHLWNCLLAALLIAALLLVPTVPALALDGEPPVDPMETVESPDPDTEPPTTPPENAGEGNDTPADENPVEGPESGPVVVSTLEALLQAIDEAEDGAIIGITEIIELEADTVLGSPDKTIIIQRVDTGERTGFITPSEEGVISIKVQNVIFDGMEIANFPAMFQIDSGDAHFENVTFKNCYGTGAGGAVFVGNGNAFFTNCTFDNNRSSIGGHIYSSSGILHLNGCTLTNGYSPMNGGGIIYLGTDTFNLENCTVTQNHADERGGGIYSENSSLTTGQINITNSKIYGNEAPKGGSDSCTVGNSINLSEELEELIALYAEDDLVPLGWFFDYPTTAIEAPNSFDRMPVMLKMCFEEPAADPEPEEPDPTPEPSPDPDPVDPTPDPEPSPEPTPSPSRPSGGYSRPSAPQEPEQEEPKEITLTNGKAVLKAPEALYWAGYKDSRGGGAEGITRADLAFLIASMMDQEGRDEWAVETVPFDDVAPDAWYAAAIGTMENTGIMVGCGNGIFAPDRPLTWGELITVFSRFTVEGEAPPEVYTGQHWAKDAINTAIALGWVEYSEAFDPGGAVTCGEMVVFIQAVFLWASD